MKKTFQKIKQTTNTILRIVISIASIILLIVFFRWAGFKGLLAFFIGMILMAYLLLSKNMMLLSVVDYFTADQYLTEVSKSKSKSKK